MATQASDHAPAPQPTADTRQVVMHPAPCASCGQRPQLARWVLLGDPAQWVCSPDCLKDIIDEDHAAHSPPHAA